MTTSKKNYFRQQSYHQSSEPMFEFEESDLRMSSSKQVDTKKSIHNSRTKNKSSKKNGERVVEETAISLPINVPDWSKILRDNELEDVDEEEENSRVVPPHEFLAKQFARAGGDGVGVGVGSFSVHEGVGRTLKGRDLNRVRDAIWKKTGFQD